LTDYYQYDIFKVLSQRKTKEERKISSQPGAGFFSLSNQKTLASIDEQGIFEMASLFLRDLFSWSLFSSNVKSSTSILVIVSKFRFKDPAGALFRSALF